LIDTNIISEVRKGPRCDPAVAEWFEGVAEDDLYLSTLVLGEIRKGIEGVADPAFRQTLTDWLEVELRHYFVGRLLDIDEAVADRWGRVQAASGRSLPVIDGLLAATALHHDLSLVTRNTRDFEGLGFEGLSLRLINPWQA
jgi:predicted nucleic acid-binding protein